MTSVELDHETHGRLLAIAAATERTAAEVAADAVAAWSRSLVGDPATPETGDPLRKQLSDRPAEALLRQSSPMDFCLEEPFRYVAPDGTEIVVPRGNVTDLASVPVLLTWLVPRYGRQSIPALLHDHLQQPELGVTSERADTIFRDTMASTGVPLVRRWLMWSAVMARTLVRSNAAWWLMVGLWVLVYGVGVGLASVLWALAGLDDLRLLHLLVPPALACTPLVTAVLWGRRYLVGLIAGVALCVVALPMLVVVLAFGVYVLAELITKPLGRRENPILTRNL